MKDAIKIEKQRGYAVGAHGLFDCCHSNVTAAVDRYLPDHSCQKILRAPFDHIAFVDKPHRRQIGFRLLYGYKRFQFDYLLERNYLLFAINAAEHNFFKISLNGHILCALIQEHKECGRHGG